MPTIVTIPITNALAGGDYTGEVLVGPAQKKMNVLLDTGSSALALDATKYSPDLAGGDKSTNLAQTDSYGDGSSWTGAVIESTITAGSGTDTATLSSGNIAVAYQVSTTMFNGYDGILGLAYAPLDDAFQMADDTWAHQYTAVEVRSGTKNDLVPYMTQLAGAGVATDMMSFYTRRSFMQVGSGDASDPMNQGLMIIGGGPERTELYTGAFEAVTVLSDEWYCTNLKEVIVGTELPIAARIQGPMGMPSNSIIDSGTNSLNLGPQLLQAILGKFPSAQRKLLSAAIHHGQLIPMSELNLDEWPALSFVLQGDAGDVKLDVPPANYWQVNTQAAGSAAAAITVGQPGLAILGLPLMNGYFTVFDGAADGGKGVIRFAAIS